MSKKAPLDSREIQHVAVDAQNDRIEQIDYLERHCEPEESDELVGARAALRRAVYLEANAYLFAAAPPALELLRDVRECLEQATGAQRSTRSTLIARIGALLDPHPGGCVLCGKQCYWTGDADRAVCVNSDCPNGNEDLR